MAPLTCEQLEELKQFDSPTIANAIELFNVRPRTEGFMDFSIKCIIPHDKPMVGYACTAKCSSRIPPTPEQNNMAMALYEKVKNAPPPCIAVIHDVDRPPVGAYWGEVQASTYKALGCVGTIIDGGVRDIDPVKELGFGYFASHVIVAHAYVHLVDYDCTVEVGGIIVKPGDLLHADKHGVVLIPPEVAPRLADACRHVQYYEEPVIQGCKARFETGISIEELKSLRAEMANRRPKFVI